MTYVTLIHSDVAAMRPQGKTNGQRRGCRLQRNKIGDGRGASGESGAGVRRKREAKVKQSEGSEEQSVWEEEWVERRQGARTRHTMLRVFVL